MATPLEMLDTLEGVIARSEAEHKRARDYVMTMGARTSTVLGCKGRIVEIRAQDVVVMFTLKQVRSMLRTLRGSLAEAATG